MNLNVKKHDNLLWFRNHNHFLANEGRAKSTVLCARFYGQPFRSVFRQSNDDWWLFTVFSWLIM